MRLHILLYFHIGELVEETTSEIPLLDGIYRINIFPKLWKFAVHDLTKLLSSFERSNCSAFLNTVYVELPSNVLHIAEHDSTVTEKKGVCTV